MHTVFEIMNKILKPQTFFETQTFFELVNKFQNDFFGNYEQIFEIFEQVRKEK